MSKSKLIDTIGNFTTIPNTVIEMGGQLGVDALALFIILRFHSGQNQIAFPGYDTIQQRCGLTRQRIAGAIRKLEAAGLLDRKRRFGASTVYTLKIPAIAISPTGGLMDDAPLVRQVDYISPPVGPSLVRQVDANKTHLTRIIEPESLKASTAPAAVDTPSATAGNHSRQQAMVGLLSRLCGLDYHIKSNAGRLAKRAAELLKANYQPEFIERHFSPGGWWYENDWRGQRGSQPTPEQIIAAVGQIKSGPAMDESEVIYFYDQNGQREWFKNGICFKTEPIPTGAET